MVRRRRQWQPTPVLLPGKSHGRRSLVGCSPWGREESDTTERLHFHFSLSCIAEGNGNPLLCSCLENPRDRGVWWAAIYGVTQSWTWLKRLSSSSSKPTNHLSFLCTILPLGFCTCCSLCHAPVLTVCPRPFYSQPLDGERFVLKVPSSLSDKGAKQGASKTTYLCELGYLIHLCSLVSLSIKWGTIIVIRVHSR